MQHKTQVLVALAALLISSQALSIGAIAVEQSGALEPAYGYSLGFSSQAAAETAALAYCQEYGGIDCKVVVWFKTCGAYAESKRFYGYGYGADRNTAKSNAMKMCKDKSCEIVVAACEGDK